MTALSLSLLLISNVPATGITPSKALDRPAELDVRGLHGVPRATGLQVLTPARIKALASLESVAGAQLQVRYNGLTATPRHLFSYAGYLTPPSPDDPEKVARDFLGRWAAIWGFDGDDLAGLRLVSRATLPDMGTTILKFEQYAAGLPVYHGEVLVNVNAAGQIINVGGDSYPRLDVTNAATLTPDAAVVAAASALGIAYSPRQIGTSRVLVTHGELAPEYVEAPTYDGGGVFADPITVTRTVFPLGATGRVAYVFTLVTPQWEGFAWEHVVDAQTGAVLRRVSLTASLGESGGGIGTGRRSTFRPDIQDRVEAYNAAGTAAGKVFDTMPTVLSGRLGAGRSPSPGVPPTYADEATTDSNSGRGFRFSLVSARNEAPLVYDPTFSQVTRGLPDASNPTPESPFGWFYLPTGSGGAEIVEPTAIHAATRGFGYTMAAEARARNLAANSPNGDGDQPFSFTLTPVRSTFLPDGRTFSAVYQSSYTEGNNVVAADDHGDDNEATHGIRGFDRSRRFVAGHFDFLNQYEYGGQDAGAGDTFHPDGAKADVWAGTVTLFYYNNILHDYLYGIGFTEALWNFQQDNFGRGGAGGDAVSAQVQDGSGTNNANFYTPADGSYPRMQMFLFTEDSFRRADGDFDFDIVAHELYHGVSNRSIGKGRAGCLGLTLVGESGGQGEGWSDYIAASMTDDDAVAEYSTGEFDVGIRRLPVTNYRWSYGSINGPVRSRRDQVAPDVGTAVPFEVHDIGEVWSAVLWDMRELLVVKDPNGTFFDGSRRLGSGASVYVGSRQLQSVDANHPIDYRSAFNTSDPATIEADQHVVRPGLVAAEIAALGHRRGPLATAVSRGARLADTLVLRGMQLSPCQPSFVDSRDAILLADRELTGGENQAIIWRAFASHGVGVNAVSTSGLADDAGTQAAPVVVEDFTVPQGVLEAEQLGPLAPPAFALGNLIANTVTVTINGGAPVPGAESYVISRGTSAEGPFTTIATVPASQTTFNDNDGGGGLTIRQPFYYQVRAARSSESVSGSSTKSITLRIGQVIAPAPSFIGLQTVTDPGQCDTLVLGWRAAGWRSTKNDVVYDVYRVTAVDPGNGTGEPSFTPSAANRIASGVRDTSYTDSGLTAGQIYYYIVQARDVKTGRLDTKGAGNRVVKLNAPTSGTVSGVPIFATEDFEGAAANTRFLPPLVDSAGPDQAVAGWQRIAGVALGDGTSSAVMYAPDFDPGSDGAPSDISAIVGPLALTRNSLVELDHFFFTEGSFDGGVIEIALGSPVFNATPYPDNTTTFDAGHYIVAGGYNGKLDGELSGVLLSALQGRRAYTGSRSLHHVRVALGSFAPGGPNNPLGLPVFLRFRMTSDAGTTAGAASGWYVDNVVVHNADPAGCAR